MLIPLNILHFVIGSKYKFRKSYEPNEKYANCNTPNNSKPIILQLNNDKNKIT